VRQAIHHQQIDRYYQWLLGESSHVRRAFIEDLNTESIDAYVKSVGPHREHCRREILGIFPESHFVEPRPRTRVVHIAPTWTAYELVLDVFQGTHSYGYLNLPNDLKPGDRRPVVFCQHGGGGNPRMVTVGDNPTYHGFAGKLAERGFITYAPSSLYADAIVRRCNVIGKTQYSVIAAQYQQVIRWLKTLPYVHPDRIGLYGLSWGGKTAMRLPILVPDFSLTICSGDFNEWIAKTTSSRDEVSYVFQPEPYIFEWNLGNTYGYAEMAALIAPRPFMVERGHQDPVGTDDWVGLEFAKVRHLYAARLKLPDRCAIDWFDGGHEIHGVESFRFLHRHLNWPETKK
jgi:pimeloyl-ACP methyl ester carboxylesterase